MSTIRSVPQLQSTRVVTARLATHALVGGDLGRPAVVLVHGNVASARFFEDLVGRLAQSWRAIAIDLRGFGDSEAKPVDASRGVRDFSEDLQAYLEASALGSDHAPVHLVGWSMGGGVVLQHAIDHPATVASVTLVSPMSPYGFAGTKDVTGTPCWADFAGSGAGTANSDLIRRIVEQDRGNDSEASPRRVLTNLYLKPSNRLAPEVEETLVSGMLSTVIGEANYPGDSLPSPNWPFAAPGPLGVVNALSPRYCNLAGFADIRPQPDVLWVRGADDQIVSDTSLIDLGYLGQLGLIPGWPGAKAFPAQPMVSQTRAVMDRYRAAGGRADEVVLADCGHSPHLERPDEFYSVLGGFLSRPR